MLEVYLKAKDELGSISRLFSGWRKCDIELGSPDFYVIIALYKQITTKLVYI